MELSRHWVSAQEYLDAELSGSPANSLQISSLEEEYPSCVRLFRSLLEKKYGALEQLVAETASIDPTTKLQGILDLLVKLSNAMRTISGPQESKILEVLRHRKVFPILMPPETVFRRVSASDVKSIWFVPDDPALSQKFRGRAPMLALPPRKVKSVLKLLQEMQLESRLLSKAVKHEFAPRGSPYIHKEYTNRLSSKAGLIKR